MTLGPDSNRVEFTKCVLQNGTDKIAEEGQWVKIEIKKRFNSNLINPLSQDIDTLLGFSLNPDDDIFTPVRLRIGYFDTYIGEIIHRAIGEMRLGEFAQVSFELDPRLLDESLAQDALDEAVYIDFKFEVNLVEIESGDGMDKSSLPIYRLDENELFDRCTDHKNDANRIFKLGRLRTAFRRYKKSIDYLIIAEQIVNEKIKRLDQSPGIPEIPDDLARNELTNMREKLLAIKSQLYSNLSLLQLKSKSYDMAVINCSKCLSIDSNNVKALFRRGQARMNLKDYDEAIGDFNRALELEPDNVEVKSNLTTCEKVKKDYERELAANLKKLFT